MALLRSLLDNIIEMRVTFSEILTSLAHLRAPHDALTQAEVLDGSGVRISPNCLHILAGCVQASAAHHI